MRLILSLALAASLSACATTTSKGAAEAPIASPPPLIVLPAPAPVLPAVSDALRRADAAYVRLRPAAEQLLGLLPDSIGSAARPCWTSWTAR